MSARQIRCCARLLLVALAALIVVTPAASGQTVSIQDSSPTTAFPDASDTHLGGEFVVSALDNEQFWPAVAYNPQQREYLVVWQNTWGGNRDIYAQRVDAQGDLLSWFAVTSGAHDRAQPAVAYDPVNQRYLITWVEDIFGDGSDWDVHGRLINWNGPDAALTDFSICDWTTKQWNPKVAYGRAQEEFLVVWWTEAVPGVPGYVSGRRVTAATGANNGNPFAIAYNVTEERVAPDVAYNLSRNEYLVTYHNGVDVFGTRLQGNGSILGSEFGIAGWPSTEFNPSVASCDSTDQYLVAWQAMETGGQYNIYARFVTGDGSPADVHHLDPYSVHQQHPDVACSGSQYLVTWEQQYSNISGPYGVWGRLMATNAAMQETVALVAPAAGITAEFSRPAAAGGHSQFLAVWEHDRANTAYQDIHARMVTPHTIFLPMVMP